MPTASHQSSAVPPLSTMTRPFALSPSSEIFGGTVKRIMALMKYTENMNLPKEHYVINQPKP
jgi:hypothetical protein